MSTVVLATGPIMLEFITKSRIRKDLLTLFFADPSREYYLQELHRLMGYSAGNIRRELLRFRKDNLFVTREVANLLYYSLNTSHPIYHELKSIVSKTIGFKGKIKNPLSPRSHMKPGTGNHRRLPLQTKLTLQDLVKHI